MLSSLCGAFVPRTFVTKSGRKERSSHLFSTVEKTCMSKPQYSTYTPSQIAQAQKDAEAYARSIHDTNRLFAMNALFVNIPERPHPTPCSMSQESRASSLPSDLPRGCLLRIGPNGASTEEGFLDGDGIVHCITLPPDGEGDIKYTATYVNTKGRKLERAVGNGKTFGGTLGAAPEGLPMLSNLLWNGLTFGTLDVQKDTCNTAIAVSGDRVLALMEQSPPSEIQISRDGKMTTIESFSRLDGAVPSAPINGGSLGAHGRTDPTTGERVHVSYTSVSRPFVRVDTFAEDWKLTSSIGVDVPVPVMVHDCALTPRYVVVLDFPLTIRPMKMFLENSFPVEYEPKNGARIGLTPRGKDKGDETMWFDVENGVVLHAANAYEKDDGTVVVHAFKSIPSGEASFILDYTPAFLYEWVLDPFTGKTITERCLNPDVMVEFPQVEDNVTGKEAPFAYGLLSTSIGGPLLPFKTPENAVLLDGVVKFALEDNEKQGFVAGDVVSRFDLPSGWHSVSEPTVVTKVGDNKGHYILLIASFVPSIDDDNSGDHIKVATDGRSLRTQLLVLDGDDLTVGPVSSVDLPYHVNYGLHSQFLEWEKMI